MNRHLEPTQESAVALMSRTFVGPVVMLNLLRFREVADYSRHPDLAPPQPISGEQAYDLYIEETLPHLHDSGGDVIFMGAGDRFLIGPEEERWDRALLVRQTGVQSFFDFARNEAYLVSAVGHRTAALEDSRLLPLA